MRLFLRQILNITTLVVITSAQLIIPQVILDSSTDVPQQQVSSEPGMDFAPSPPMLSDVLALEPQASIFFSYARESARLSGILAGVKEYGGENNYTVFAPTNKAVMALTRKPHLGPTPPEGPIEISDEEADRQSAENVERWVSAHIIPESLELSSSGAVGGEHQSLLDGRSLSLTHGTSHDSPEWKNWRLNGDVAIIGQREASNGIMYLIERAMEV